MPTFRKFFNRQLKWEKLAAAIAVIPGLNALLLEDNSSYLLLENNVDKMLLENGYIVEDNLDWANSTLAQNSPAKWVESGTVVWNYATSPAPLGGYSGSVQVNASTDSITTILPSELNEVWVYFLTSTTSTASNSLRVQFRDITNTIVLADMQFIATGIVRVNAGSGGNGSSSAGVITANQQYHIWLRFLNNGTNTTLEAYISTDGIKPGTATATRTDPGTIKCGACRLGLSTSTLSVYNKIRISAVPIGDNPS